MLKKKYISILLLFIYSFITILKVSNKVPEKKKNYILIADPKILSIPIKECNEKLIDIKNLKKEDQLVYLKKDYPDYTLIRESVYKKLKLADEILIKKHKLRICLNGGYRSLKRQKQIFDNSFNKNKAKKEFIGKSYEEIFLETIKSVSPIINLDKTVNIPPHNTGGAIDCYLVDMKTLKPVDMGHGIKFDSISETDSPGASKIQHHYRKIMSEVLLEVGFVNYPYEWWHWSYGDRYYAYQTKSKYAIYGGIENNPFLKPSI